MFEGIGEFAKAHLWEVVTAVTGALLGVKDMAAGSRLVTFLFFVASLIFAFAAVPPLLAWAKISEADAYRPIALFMLALVAVKIFNNFPLLVAKIKDVRLPYSGGNS